MNQRVLLALWVAIAAPAEVTSYRSESDYLAALRNLGYTSFQEGFEDDAVWAAARSPKSALSIASLGIDWISNTRLGRITTAPGPARTGQWAVFSSPHGDPEVVSPTGFIRDGFIGSRRPGQSKLHGAGAWFTGTPGGQLLLILDGNAIELGPLDSSHRFFGVIDTRGFMQFEVREKEGTREDQKFVFADDFTLAAQGQQGIVHSVSAASFLLGAPLAPGSLASAFGQGLTGALLKLKDSAGVEHLPPLLFVSPSQINYLIPESVRTGPAGLTVLRGDQLVATGTLQVEAVSPGLFTVSADGKGAAAAVPVEPDFLLLFGTGIGGRSTLSAVKVQIGGLDAEVLYAGPQSEFPGLDQVNVKVPQAVIGGGLVDLLLVVDGKAANPVKVQLETSPR